MRTSILMDDRKRRSRTTRRHKNRYKKRRSRTTQTGHKPRVLCCWRPLVVAGGEGVARGDLVLLRLLLGDALEHALVARVLLGLLGVLLAEVLALGVGDLLDDRVVDLRAVGADELGGALGAIVGLRRCSLTLRSWVSFVSQSVTRAAISSGFSMMTSKRRLSSALTSLSLKVFSTSARWSLWCLLATYARRCHWSFCVVRRHPNAHLRRLLERLAQPLVAAALEGLQGRQGHAT